jgi:hypothetical protein
MIDFFYPRYRKHEEEVSLELTELQEKEREMVYEWGGLLSALQGQQDHSLAPEEMLPLTRKERAELQHKVEETSNLQEQVWPLS